MSLAGIALQPSLQLAYSCRCRSDFSTRFAHIETLHESCLDVVCGIDVDAAAVILLSRILSCYSSGILFHSSILPSRDNQPYTMPKTYTYSDLQQHVSSESCWVALYGNVYDVTSFLPNHPGGTKIVLQLAGTDATEQYDPVHPPGTLEEVYRQMQSSEPSTRRLYQRKRKSLPSTQTVSYTHLTLPTIRLV